jgi:hypothetical protein
MTRNFQLLSSTPRNTAATISEHVYLEHYQLT